MMDLHIQDSEKCVRHGIWKLKVHTFQPQYLLSDHLNILKWFWLISVPNKLIHTFLKYFFIIYDLGMTRMFLKTFDSDLESLDLILSLNKTT